MSDDYTGTIYIDPSVTASGPPAMKITGKFSASGTWTTTPPRMAHREHHFGDIVRTEHGDVLMVIHAVHRRNDLFFWRCIVLDEDMSRPDDLIGDWKPEEIE